ncbi:Origin recognition complex subunit 2 [Cadophora gregata]|uniref:Origin recognition complex subunit 2 n=1 Tax=Cadophora gregata TaxID=51156 RepID=UPI0026DBE427|nr:Origin recognition complex subunit 2 [Cadophora gregata]KAK0099908.1 Origin recognition complex subunit 2 [Cadophora gregata f. sp. sojae]KAK0116243.1 Origin recognition complex subunit 2 [Cadophora gregata]
MKRRKADLAEIPTEDAPALKRTRPTGGTVNAAFGAEENLNNPKSTTTEELSEAGESFEVSEIENGHNVEDDDLENGAPDNEAEVAGARKATHGTSNRASDTFTTGTTPRKQLPGKKLFATPVKTSAHGVENNTPRIERNANRSARRKSTRTLIERTILGNTSENDDEDEEIAQQIYDSGDEGVGQDEDQDMDEATAPETPSKKGRKKGMKSQRRSPTPPQDLTAHEKFFFQNRGGRAKTSNNTLASLALLDHEEYFSHTRNSKDPHAEDVKFLEQLHAESFNQWHFELSQNFNICAFGWGSKRSLLMRFADHIYKSQTEHSKAKIVVVNGYVSNLTIRDVLSTIASAVAERGIKLGSHPAEMIENLIALLEEDEDTDITLIIHSIDGAPLRKPATQTVLSRLSAHPQIHLVASADHPSFPLLWDSSLRSAYNFLFHDCTTFQPYNSEVDVVDEVHELLGRSGRRVGGREGVSFVLKSLPENAKNLFRVLIGEQLAAMDGCPGELLEGAEGEDGIDPQFGNPRRGEVGVEYRVLYQKAVEEFICSNEMNFRTLLKEFHDHQMIQSRKDGLGIEILSVPFRKEELEIILEDIVS